MHDGLNAAQREAVLHRDGALLVVAGAGAGKTRVVVHRIAELIKGGVAPEKILAVTFTNKAAGEMRDRVRTLLGADLAFSPYDQPRSLPFVGTFHGLSLHILKTFPEAAGLGKHFTIYDRSDSQKVLKEAIAAVGFDPKELEPRRVLSIMSRAKGDGLGVDQFRAERTNSYIDEAVAEVWERYDAALAKENALDFDDILLRAYQLLRKSETARTHFQNAWSHLHVDEYQDTNRVQYALVHLLAEPHGNIAAVGDIDQNIYSWRGASITHMMNFEHDFPNAHIVTLSENYRSTKTIIQAANDAIAKNVHRREKVLFTNNHDGEPISVSGHATEIDEATFICDTARSLMRNGFSPNDIAVLYRANFQSRVLEEAFLGSGVPYQVLGTRFFERKEIKDALSYLRLALNPDSAADLARAVGAPARGVGKVTLAKMAAHDLSGLAPAQRKKVDDFFALIARIRTHADHSTVSETVRYVVEASGLWALYKEGRGEDQERLENLKELVSTATKYDTLAPEEGVQKFLEEAALQSDQDELGVAREEREGVKLMTVHASKGLEFPVVFIAGLEEGLFPHERLGTDLDDPEEERRLFYVALTRAEKKVFMTYAATRTIFGARRHTMPSAYILELDPALAEVTTPYYRANHQEGLEREDMSF